MTITVYTADWLLPVCAPPIEQGALAIEGDKILAAGARAEVRAQLIGRDHNIVALNQCAIMPGLVNVHTHLELTAMRGFLEGFSFHEWIQSLIAARMRMRAEDLRASAIWGACEATRAGITTLADTGDSGAALTGMTTTGLRGIVYQEVFGPDPAQATESLNGLKKKVAALIKQASALTRIGVSPHAPYSVSAQLFRNVAEYAIKERLPMAIHCAESAAEEELVRDGGGAFALVLRKRGIAWQATDGSVVEYLERAGALAAHPLLIHCVRTNDIDLRIISENNCSIAHCPKSNARFGHGRARLAAMLAAGIKVGLGSDSVASNNICDLIDEARASALIQRAADASSNFSAREMIAMMTRGGAEALAMSDQIGTLAAGKQADFIALDLSDARLLPIHDIEAAVLFSASARDVSLTVVAGEEIFRDGQIKRIDEESARDALLRAAQRIKEK
jgi:5-methylthioadenosine/S-adenosylhomocysteine deaminase